MNSKVGNHIVPFLVWLLAVGGVVFLLMHRSSQRLEIIGIARGQVHQIAATCDGRLRSVPVNLFQEVREGQVLAVVDTVLENEALPAQLGAVEAEIAHLTSELGTIEDTYQAERADRQLNYVADKRRFAMDVESARLRILELNAQLASDRIMLGDLDAELKIAERLLEEDVIEPYELEKARVQYETLAKKIEENERLLEQAKKDLEESAKRYAEYERHTPYDPSIDNALDVVRKAIQVQEQFMNELLTRMKPLELKSPIDGVVIPIVGNRNEVNLYRPGEKVVRRAGEAVMAGEPILAVAERRPREIIAYANERQAVYLREGMLVEAVTNGTPAQMAKSQITHVSPVVEQMPERLWRNPAIPQWGRAFLVSMHPELDLVSGELVRIRLLSGDAAGGPSSRQ